MKRKPTHKQKQAAVKASIITRRRREAEQAIAKHGVITQAQMT